MGSPVVNAIVVPCDACAVDKGECVTFNSIDSDCGTIVSLNPTWDIENSLATVVGENVVSSCDVASVVIGVLIAELVNDSVIVI